ncbi:MAG: MFS transporter [Actinomyces sp.]|nr:MAG: MFS transporter [Actinomyces sp.]
MPARDDDTPRPRLRDAVVALRQPNFRRFWVGGIISNTGRFFQAIALPAVVWELTASAGWVGLAGFAQFFPMALVGPVAGAIADRYTRRRVLLFTQSSQALVSLGFMALWAGGVRSPTAYVAMSVAAGVTGGLNLPAWQAFVSELVPRELLLNAVTLNSAQFNAARMFGPALAGVTVASLGPAWAFAINAVSFGAVIIALLRIDTPPAVTDRSTRMRPLREMADTVRHVRRRPGIVTAIVTVALIGLFGLPIQSLSVVFAGDVFGVGEGGFGLMVSMIGLGAVASAPVIASVGARMPRSRLQGMAMVSYAVAIGVFALAPVFPLALVGLALLGASHLASASTLNTTVQLQVDDDRRAKVLALYLMVLLLANPLGQLILGQSMEMVGPRPTVAVAAAVMGAAVLALRASGRLAALDGEGGRYEPRVAPEVHPSMPVPPRGVPLGGGAARLAGPGAGDRGSSSAAR